MTRTLLCCLPLLAILGCDAAVESQQRDAASLSSTTHKGTSGKNALVRYSLGKTLTTIDSVNIDSKADEDDPNQDIQDCLDNNDNFSSCGSCCVDAFYDDYGLMEACILECRDQCPDEDPEEACPQLAGSYEECSSCCLGGFPEDGDEQGACLETCDDACFDNDCGEILIGG